LETEINLDPELITDPDPNLQIILDPAGSGCTTLGIILKVETVHELAKRSGERKN
jgi:hypothetical protein